MNQLLEELTLNAWPSLQTVFYDGWAVRFANGYTRRANSVNVLHESTLDLAEKVATCEATYAARGLRTVFKIVGEAGEPPVRPYHDLESFLEARGYVRDAPTSVQVVALGDVDLSARMPYMASLQNSVKITTALTDAWLEAYFRLNAERQGYQATLRQMLESLIPMRCYASIEQSGEIVALGMGVLERGYLCLMGIVTTPVLRQQGLGTQLMLSLMDWGKVNGARHAYLQVMCDNQTALRLYHKLGFREVYQYWYRVK